MAKISEKIGVVVSNKMQKTVTVTVESKIKHPIYEKLVRKNKKFKADNQFEDVKVGDLVKISQTKPISKEKHWKVVEVLKNASKQK